MIILMIDNDRFDDLWWSFWWLTRCRLCRGHLADHFDDWRWSFWKLTMITIYSAPGWSSRSSSQKDLQSFLVGPAWSPYGSLGPRGRTLTLNQCFYHRAILIMIQRLFSPTILFLVWWHVCTSEIPLLPPCMCTPPCRTSIIFFVLANLLRYRLSDITWYSDTYCVSGMSFNPNSGLVCIGSRHVYPKCTRLVCLPYIT